MIQELILRDYYGDGTVRLTNNDSTFSRARTTCFATLKDRNVVDVILLQQVPASVLFRSRSELEVRKQNNNTVSSLGQVGAVPTYTL